MYPRAAKVVHAKNTATVNDAGTKMQKLTAFSVSLW